MAFTTGPNGELLDEYGNPVGPASGATGGGLPNPALSGAGGGPGLPGDADYQTPPVTAPAPAGIQTAASPPMPVLPSGLPPLPAAAPVGMTKQSSTTTTVNETKAAKQALKDEKAARTEFENAAAKLAAPTEKDRSLVERTNTLNTQAAGDKLAVETQAAEDQRRALADRDRVTAERSAKIQEVQAASDAERQKYSGMKIRDYFGPGGEGEGKHGQVLLGIAMSGIGSALRGTTGNSALDQMNLKIERFHKSEVERIEHQAEVWKQSRVPVEDAERQKAAELHDLDAKTAAVRETIAQEARRKAAQRGLSSTQIENDSAIQNLDKLALQADQERKQRAVEYADKDLAHAASLRSTTMTTSVHQEGSARAGGAGGKDGSEGDVLDAKGNLIGRVTSGRGGAQAFMTRDADYSRAQEQLQALQRDIAENGERVFSPAAIKRRQTLLEDAKIAVATVSPLGKTNEAMHSEGGSIGANHGAVGGMLIGDNPDAVANKIKQLGEQQQRYRNQGLLPVSNGRSVAPTTSIPKGDVGAAGATRPPPLSRDERIMLKAAASKGGAEGDLAKQILAAAGAN